MSELLRYHRDDIPQVIPSSTCLTCEVCCRFPEKESLLAPYFTDEEVHRAIGSGVDRRYFKKRSQQQATQIELIPHGDGYICPSFNPETHECKIYPVRPLDCQLYPFVLMRGHERDEVLLGIDHKCPFLQGDLPKRMITPSVHEMVARLESDRIVALLGDYPELVGPHQGDVWVLQRLPRLTARIYDRYIKSPWMSLQPLGLEQIGLVEASLGMIPCSLSSWNASALFLWQDFFRYYWTFLEGCFCVFAESDGYLYMPLPPLGRSNRAHALMAAFELMGKINGDSEMTRVENIPRSLLDEYSGLGLKISEKPPDYLYDREALVVLQGDRYKGKRSAYNYFTKHSSYSLEVLGEDQTEECLSLYRAWQATRRVRSDDPFYHDLLEDGFVMHRRAFAFWEILGLQGLLVRIGGQVRGYTFGIPLGSALFCILGEVVDREIKGLAQFIFREFCRDLEGYALINTMDDSGLDGLRRLKESYHPARRETSFMAKFE